MRTRKIFRGLAKQLCDFVTGLKFPGVKSMLTEQPILLYIYNMKINNVCNLLPLLDGIIYVGCK